MSSGWVNSSEPVPNLSITQGTRLAVELFMTLGWFKLTWFPQSTTPILLMARIGSSGFGSDAFNKTNTTTQHIFVYAEFPVLFHELIFC